jgi:hypothetical protein
MRRRTLWMLLATLALVLYGCSGGSSASPAPSPTSPTPGSSSSNPFVGQWVVNATDIEQGQGSLIIFPPIPEGHEVSLFQSPDRDPGCGPANNPQWTERKGVGAISNSTLTVDLKSDCADPQPGYLMIKTYTFLYEPATDTLRDQLRVVRHRIH